MAESEPPRTRLRQLLERPEARPRVSRAVASLLMVSVVAMAALGALIIWHLVRRGRLIRERLNPPRPVRWPDLGPIPGEPDESTRSGPAPDVGGDGGRETTTELHEERREL